MLSGLGKQQQADHAALQCAGLSAVPKKEMKGTALSPGTEDKQILFVIRKVWF